MSVFPWRNKGDEPALDDLLDGISDESPPSLDRTDEHPGAVRSNEEEELLDQYVMPETLIEGAIDTESAVDGPDLSLEVDVDEAGDSAESDDVADEVMAIFDDEAEEDEDMAALSRGLEDVDATQLLEQVRSVGRSLASRVEAN